MRRWRWCQWRSRALTALEDLALWWLRHQGMDLATIGYHWGAYAVVAWGPRDVQERRAGLTTGQAVDFLCGNEAPIAQAMVEAGAEQMSHQFWIADLNGDLPPAPEEVPAAVGG